MFLRRYSIGLSSNLTVYVCSRRITWGSKDFTTWLSYQADCFSQKTRHFSQKVVKWTSWTWDNLPCLKDEPAWLLDFPEEQIRNGNGRSTCLQIGVFDISIRYMDKPIYRQFWKITISISENIDLAQKVFRIYRYC